MNEDLNGLVNALVSLAPDAPIRLRRGQIISVQADGTCTITIGGGTNQVAGVKVAASCCPLPNAGCWIATDGRDLFVLSTLAPAGPAYGFMRQSSAQSIGTGTWTELSWANRTDVVTSGITVGSSGFTIVVPGIYQVSACISFAANSTGQRHLQIYKNGSTILQSSGGNAAAGSDIQRLSGSGNLKLAIGDVINATVYQTSGGNLNTQIGAGHNILMLTWIGPSA